ncbi:hypothetical protein K3495_g1112 [Podosphaera aphanis]|nr:hypothetical protein K3495_g1112 [Podosphaera aphanis]
MSSPYQQHQNPQAPPNFQPPAPPPKPSTFSLESSQRVQGQDLASLCSTGQNFSQETAPSDLQDPGDQWIPKMLEDKSKQQLTEILENPSLIAAITQASATAHPSIALSQSSLKVALDENIALASHLTQVESHLSELRSSTQAQLLSTHALERQWRQKQTEMDQALAPFMPSSLYQNLCQRLQEQEAICCTVEESFLDGDGSIATEREVTEWVRKFRDSKKLYYSRQAKKERWDEGRVGGWR